MVQCCTIVPRFWRWPLDSKQDSRVWRDSPPSAGRTRACGAKGGRDRTPSQAHQSRRIRLLINWVIGPTLLWLLAVALLASETMYQIVVRKPPHQFVDAEVDSTHALFPDAHLREVTPAVGALVDALQRHPARIGCSIRVFSEARKTGHRHVKG
jgi:hypothetical protein